MEMDQAETEQPGVDVGVAGNAVAVMSTALDWLTSGELWRLSDAQLTGLARLLHAVESRVGAASVAVLSEAVGRGLPVGSGALSGAAWLRAHVPITPGQAKARAFLAEVLPSADLAPTRAALAAGAISPGQAAVVARTMAGLDALPVAVDEQTRADAQQVLLRFADRLDPAQLGQAGARVRYNLDPKAGERLARDEDAQAEAQEAYLVQDVATGMWHGRLVLAPTDGAMLRAALDPLAAPEPAADGTRDARPARRRLAEAFSRLAQRCLLAGPGSLSRLPARQGSPIRVAITADLDTAIAAYHQPGLAAGELDTGQPGGWLVSPLTVQTVLCDAELVPVLADASGRALDVGRTRYAFPPRIRKAIELRDRHCTFPGCTRPAEWCQTHHLIPYSLGGATCEDNGALLCGPHHRYVHAHGWVGAITDGQVIWRPPDRDEALAPNAYLPDLRAAIRELTTNWLARNPRLTDTG